MRRGGEARVVRTVAVALACCAIGAGGGRQVGGAMGEVTVKRLGQVRPGESGGENRRELVDPAPRVMWAGGRPAVVLYHHMTEEGAAGALVQEWVRLPDGPGEAPRTASGPFPLATRTALARSPGDGGKADLYAEWRAVPADLDGDGVDELVLPRRLGGVDVVGAKDVRYRFPGVSGNPAVASYTPRAVQVAQVGARAVVHVLFRRELHGSTPADAEEVGAGDRYGLVRVDGRGVRRVVLKDLGWEPREVIAVGAVNKPGSSEVDELVAISRKDDGPDAWVSRHRPDGVAIGPPRRIYVPFAAGGAWTFEFLPQSRTTLAVGAGERSVYFLEAEKPVNWIRRVDLKPALGDQEVQFIGVADAATSPKAVLYAGGAVWAVDVEGRYQAAPGGAPAVAPSPLERLDPPSPDFGPGVVVPSPLRGDELLVAYSRPRTAKQLGPAEITAAADRFLAPEYLAEERRLAEPSLADRDPVRDALIASERKRRGVDQPLDSNDTWKRLLPESYEAAVKDRRGTLESHLRTRLLVPILDSRAVQPQVYRDLEGLRRWLVALDLPAETVFEVHRRGQRIAQVRVAGELGPFDSSQVGAPWIAWRHGDAGTVVVTTLSVVEGGAATPAPGFYALQAAGGR